VPTPIMGAMANLSARRLRALATLSLCLTLGMAQAQESESYEPDPPDRAARLSFIQGDVSMQPAGEEDWAPAILNRPLTTGDKLWTDRDSRAEIQVGPAAVRLDANTGFSFLNVDDDTIQMRMTAGVISVSVRDLPGSENIEIDTPNIALSILRRGTYRVEVNDAGDATIVKISEGEAEATGPSQLNVIVHAQETVTFTGEERLTTRHERLGSPDAFDSWALDRERRYERAGSRSSEYVARDVTGYEDLDEHGSWSSEPEYGYVWTPRHVSIGWSPYRYGRWVWVSPWGWTWIDDSPWGYAPFHYGRWAYTRHRWCWVPGPRHVRAVYAPALVGWIGPPGLHVGARYGGGGRVGWFPLGPREVYVPSRRFSRRWTELVNVTNTRIVNRAYINEVYEQRGRNVDYRNRRVQGAVTSVAENVFRLGGRTRDSHLNVDQRELARDQASARAPDIAPVRESRLGGAARADMRRPPQTVLNRQVIVKRDPPASGARFARSTGGRIEVPTASSRPVARPRVDSRDESVVRSRPDRPVRTERPSVDSTPREQRGADARVVERVVESRREDRPSGEQRAHLDERQRDQRNQRDADQQRDQQQNRERYERSRESERPPAARQVEQREKPVQREQPIRREQPVQRERSERQERSSPPPRVERSQDNRSNNRSEPKSSEQSYRPPKGRESQPKSDQR
jgi:hypothetical protein